MNRRTLATLAAAGIVATGLANVPAQARTEYMPCGTEDDTNCVWDARHRGNGTGRSYFVNRDGRVFVLPHHVAHYLVTGE